MFAGADEAVIMSDQNKIALLRRALKEYTDRQEAGTTGDPTGLPEYDQAIAALEATGGAKYTDRASPIEQPGLTPIEQLVAALLVAGWEAGDILIPEQCAEMWNPVAQRWVHVTASYQE